MNPIELSGGPSWTSQPSPSRWLGKLIRCRWTAIGLLLCLTVVCGCGGMSGCNGSSRPPLANRAVPVRPVRVRLLEDVKLLELATSGPYVVTDEQGGVLWQSASGESFKIGASREGILLNGRLLARESLYVKPTSLGIIRLAKRSYRGYLRLVKNSNGSSLMVINHVPLEDYVASVVGSELPEYFHPEAFRAQAVAARTYVLHRMINTGRRNWDVAASAASQVYSGLDGETNRALEAQRSTKGEALFYGPPGQEKIICAFYCSTCGGGTRAVWELKKGFEHIQPLAGVKIDQCEASRYYRWKKRTWSKTKLQEALANSNARLRALGPIERVQISIYTPQGRAREIAIYDQQGRRFTISGEELRSALGLLSDWFKIEDHGSEVWFTKGRGWGHGMGMCQFGADRLARHGYPYNEILSTYYPGSKLERCY